MLILIGIFFAGYFSYHIFYGARSVAELNDIHDQINISLRELKDIQEDRMQIEEKVTMLRIETLSTDFLEERAREVLGYRVDNQIILKE